MRDTRPHASDAAQVLALAQEQAAQARRSLIDGEPLALGPLVAALEDLGKALVTLPQTELPRLRRPLLALLDEVGGLSRDMAEERARLGTRLRAMGSHRHAVQAYRQPERR